MIAAKNDEGIAQQACLFETPLPARKTHQPTVTGRRLQDVAFTLVEAAFTAKATVPGSLNAMFVVVLFSRSVARCSSRMVCHGLGGVENAVIQQINDLRRVRGCRWRLGPAGRSIAGRHGRPGRRVRNVHRSAGRRARGDEQGHSSGYGGRRPAAGAHVRPVRWARHREKAAKPTTPNRLPQTLARPRTSVAKEGERGPAAGRPDFAHFGEVDPASCACRPG